LIQSDLFPERDGSPFIHMLCRYWMWGVVLVASSVLVAGCGSVPPRKVAPQKVSAAAALKRERAEDELAERRAQAHAHYAAGVIREMNNEQPAATEEYCQAALLDPGDEALTLEVTSRLLQAKQPDRALAVLLRATAKPDASGEVYARLGLVYSQLGKADQAVAANRTAIRKSPGSLAGYHNLFLGYLAGKQPQEALNALDEAARQSKPDADFLVGLADLYLSFGAQVPAQKDGAKAKALAAVNRAAQLSPTTPLQRLKLADGFSLLGEPEKAAQLYLEVLKHPPDLPQVEERVRAILTTIYLRSNDHKRAAEQLQAILRDDPTNPQARYYLGRLALEDKKPAEAADHFSKTILLSPGFESGYCFLALAQIEMDKISEALATLGNARQRFPQSFDLEFYTGLAFSRQKAYAEAVQHYFAAEVIAQATDPQQLREGFYFQLGSACERKGDYVLAEKYFEKCLVLAPDFAEAMNYLGYMWAEHGEKLDKARELIEKALKTEPKNDAYLDSMAWVLFKQKQPQEALPYALKAAELSEKPDATLHDHIGDIYEALKQPEKAREAWRKSLSLEPNEEVRKKLESSGPK
jgi:tetratricopeptide (TPR) repeat protein